MAVKNKLDISRRYKHTGTTFRSMNKRDRIEQLLREHGNALSTEQAAEQGISKALLAHYARKGLLERVRHGVYALSGDWRDDMCELLRVASHAVFSHETALYLHGLSERTPFRYMLTIPADTSLPPSIKAECRCFYVKPELYPLGLTSVTNNMGHSVRCYDKERTLCDLVRSRGKMEPETLIHALRHYAALPAPEKNLPRLMEYAQAFRITRPLRNYLEILL